MKTSTWWTTEQDELLRQLYPTATKAQLVLQFERPINGIYHRAWRLGLEKTKYDMPLLAWANDDIGKLRTMYAAASLEELQAAFPTHNLYAIGKFARKIGLSRDNSVHYSFGQDHHNYVERVPLICPQCGSSFGRKPSSVHKANYCSMRCKMLQRKNTSIEIAMRDGLASAGIIAEPQWRVGYWHVDFAILTVTPKIAIECDGIYWHGIKRGKNGLTIEQRLVMRRDKQLAGYVRKRPAEWVLLRFTETKINADIGRCISKIKERL